MVLKPIPEVEIIETQLSPTRRVLRAIVDKRLGASPKAVKKVSQRKGLPLARAVQMVLSNHSVFYISHFPYNVGRVCALESDLSHQGGKEAKLVTSLKGEKLDSSESFNSLLAHTVAQMSHRVLGSMEKKAPTVRAAYGRYILSELVFHTMVLDDAAAFDAEQVKSAIAFYSIQDSPKPAYQAAIQVINGLLGKVVTASVAIDASCSAFQHGAALVHDSELGDKVNLGADVKLHDIYLDVAAELRNLVAGDASLKSFGYTKGGKLLDGVKLEDIQKLIVDLAGELVSRGLTKVPTMILAYGGGKNAILNGLQDTFLGESEGWYLVLTNLIMSSRTGVVGVKVLAGMKLFRDIQQATSKTPKHLVVEPVYPALPVSGIADSHYPSGKDLITGEAAHTPEYGVGVPMVWDNGNGMVITNTPKHSFNHDNQYMTSETFNKSKVKELVDTKRKSPIRDMNQKAMPSAIHSRDAAHLHRVVNEAPFDLLVIHDSWSSHPNHTAELNRIVRSTFLDLYRGEDSERVCISHTLKMNRGRMSDCDYKKLVKQLVVDVQGNEWREDLSLEEQLLLGFKNRWEMEHASNNVFCFA